MGFLNASGILPKLGKPIEAFTIRQQLALTNGLSLIGMAFSTSRQI
jgi:hypothetical protein